MQLHSIHKTTALLFLLNLVFAAINSWLGAANEAGDDCSSFGTAKEVEPTYVGDDFPRYLRQTSSEAMIKQTVLDQTFHFTTTHNNSAKWDAILPSQVGYIRLGPSHRVFAISMFHQLHCLIQFAQLLADMNPDSVPSTALPNWEDRNHSGHVQHCFNYVRQNILCAADETEEDGGWMCRRLAVLQADGRERQCRDWSRVYKVVEDAHLNWLRTGQTSSSAT